MEQQMLTFSWEEATATNGGKTKPSSAEPQPVVSSLEYEVFLSFRGPDVRKSFADFLYSYLVRSKIRTFRDEEDLRKGETIAPSLVRAIAESKICIPILSSNYATSKWCLGELAKMVECWRKQGNGLIILPVFYFVDPGDVRHQSGPYEEAFAQHSKKHDPLTVQEWRTALREVGQMKGWHVTELDGQGAVINEIFSKVELHLRSYYTLVTDELVGMDFHLQQVTRLLNLDSGGGKVVGIHGIGGIGKTTIAKAVYDNIVSSFDRCCFVENVREMLSKDDGIIALQSKVISSILRNDIQVKDASQGVNMIRERVCKYKVLVVLDDVDDRLEFGQILGKLGHFSIESRFIITTRDKRVVELLPQCSLYEPKEWSYDHSLQLFSKHAFGMHYPPEGYAVLCDEFVKVAVKLPLALKVIGSLLFQRDKQFWEEKLMELKQVPATSNKVLQRLKISYDELNHSEKQIFLDIACFFVGEDKELPFHLWNGRNFYPECGTRTLILRSLIKLDGNNRLWMHDLLRDLGRAIVIEEDITRPYNRSRIFTNEDATNMLNNGEGSDRVEMLSIRHLRFTDKAFEKLSRLKYLAVTQCAVTGDFREKLPDMQWLRLNNTCLTPADFNLKNVVVLDLQDACVLDDWKGCNRVKVAKKLKVINLKGCIKLTRVPDFSQCGSLESLDLTGCFRMSGELNIGSFRNLKVVRLQETGITLTGDMEKLQKLQEIKTGLSSWGAEQVPVIPTSVKRLTISSPRVPNLLELKDLEELCFDNCGEAPEIPGDIWKLSKLKTLKMLRCSCSCSNGSPLLDEYGTLPSSLTCLVVDWWGLSRLPNLANMNNLMELRLRNLRVNEIQGLRELKVLEALEISESTSLDHLHGLENLLHLKELTLKSCEVLKDLPSLSNLIKLHKLVIVNCPLLGKIEGGLGELRRSLLHLEVTGCVRPANIDGLEFLEALESLTLKSTTPSPPPQSAGDQSWKSVITTKDEDAPPICCQYLNPHEPFPDLSRLQNLKQLCISGWRQLPEVTGLGRLKSLQSLEMKACTTLKRLPNLSGLDNLETLDVSGCIQLVDVRDLSSLVSLKKLNFSDCWSIEELPDVSGLNSLDVLDVRECINLVTVTGMEKLESLSELHMVNCKSIKELPDMSGLKNLQSIDLRGCTQLKTVKGLEEIRALDVHMDDWLMNKYLFKLAVWPVRERARLAINAALGRKW